MRPTVPQGLDKKPGSGRGCLITVAVVGGVAVFGCLAFSVVGWRLSQTPEGQKVVSAMGKGVTMMGKGFTAKGASELRAAGCQQAFVLDTSEVLEVLDTFRDGGRRAATAHRVVTCQGGVFTALPDCDQVASVYLGAVGDSPGGFVVVVQRQGQQVCTREYSAGGALLRDLKAR